VGADDEDRLVGPFDEEARAGECGGHWVVVAERPVGVRQLAGPMGHIADDHRPLALGLDYHADVAPDEAVEGEDSVARQLHADAGRVISRQRSASRSNVSADSTKPQGVRSGDLRGTRPLLCGDHSARMGELAPFEGSKGRSGPRHGVDDNATGSISKPAVKARYDSRRIITGWLGALVAA
jgi:hypothetical protein